MRLTKTLGVRGCYIGGQQQAMAMVLLLMLMTASVLVVTYSIVTTESLLSAGGRERSEELRRKVRQVCEALNISTPVIDLQLNNIFVDERRRLLYCSVPKAASTSWKRVLIGPFSKDRDARLISRDAVHSYSYVWSLYHPRFDDIRWDMLTSYKKLLFIRHPFERVVATYKDKLEQPTGLERLDFSSYMKNKIKEKFGVRSGETVSFPDFVQFITEQSDEEVVELDPHWRSLHQLCNPCAIDYDFIGKFERLAEDSRFALRWMGVKGGMDTLPTALRPTFAGRDAPRYFSQLDSHLRRAFFAKYFLDYISFDYAFL